jgi:hypothetical protein
MAVLEDTMAYRPPAITRIMDAFSGSVKPTYGRIISTGHNVLRSR